MSAYKELYKAVMLGDSHTGKSCISVRFTEGCYSRGYVQKFNFTKKEKNNEKFSIFSLSMIFHDLMVSLPSDLPYNVSMDSVSVDEQVMFLIGQFESSNRIFFHDLIPFLKTRLKIIVTFMAILQMLQESQLQIEQKEPFADIVLIKKKS